MGQQETNLERGLRVDFVTLHLVSDHRQPEPVRSSRSRNVQHKKKANTTDRRRPHSSAEKACGVRLFTFLLRCFYLLTSDRYPAVIVSRLLCKLRSKARTYDVTRLSCRLPYYRAHSMSLFARELLASLLSSLPSFYVRTYHRCLHVGRGGFLLAGDRFRLV